MTSLSVNESHNYSVIHSHEDIMPFQKWKKMLNSTVARPPSKVSCVCLTTPYSVQGIGGVVFVAGAGFAPLNGCTPKQFTTTIANQKVNKSIKNKHHHKKNTCLQSSANVSSPPQCSDLLLESLQPLIT